MASNPLHFHPHALPTAALRCASEVVAGSSFVGWAPFECGLSCLLAVFRCSRRGTSVPVPCLGWVWVFLTCGGDRRRIGTLQCPLPSLPQLRAGVVSVTSAAAAADGDRDRSATLAVAFLAPCHNKKHFRRTCLGAGRGRPGRRPRVAPEIFRWNGFFLSSAGPGLADGLDGGTRIPTPAVQFCIYIFIILF